MVALAVRKHIAAGIHSIGATLYVTMVTCHHHFGKWWWLSPPLFQSGICKRIVYFLLTEAFCGQKYAENAIAAGAPPRTPLGELTTLPKSPSGLGSGHTPIPHTTRRLWRLYVRAFGASIVVLRWHQILATPLVTTTFKGKVAPVIHSTSFEGLWCH